MLNLIKNCIFVIGFILITTYVHANERDFTSFLDPKKPHLSENPASIALIPGDYFEANIPIIYSSSDVTRQKKYYGDIYNGEIEAYFEKENTTIIGGTLATRNYGITYNRQISKFGKDSKNNSEYWIINDENYQEESIGLAIGNIFGPVILGLHQERVTINTKLDTILNLNDEVTYKSEYDKQTFGIIIPFLSISASYQPEIDTKFKRVYRIEKEIDYTVPSKYIYGIQLYLDFFKNIEPKIAFDLGNTGSMEGSKTAEGIAPESSLIKGELASFNIYDTFGITYGQREYPLGNLQIKKKFSNLKIKFFGFWNFGYNEFFVTDKSGNTVGYKYPEFSVTFDFNLTGRRCSVWKENVVTSCD